jgi:hypothetical protein
MNRRVRAFEVYPCRKPEWSAVVNACSAGQAKSIYARSLWDPWPDIPFTDLRCRVAGPAFSSAQFIRTAAGRGLPEMRCGARVAVGQATGTVVDADCSANFVVLFDCDSPAYAGARLSVHPSELKLLTLSPE